MLAAQESGLEFHIAGNWSYSSDGERIADEEQYGIKIHQIDFFRTPYHPGNLKAYRQLKDLVRSENYYAIHCNTPIGGVLGRIIGKQCNVEKVIYQARGFHFYNGAPKKNWLLYYPVEKWLAHYTDVLITINQEDYGFAKRKLKLRNGGMVYYVPGAGISLSNYENIQIDRNEKRRGLGLGDTDVICISAGEMNANKNYRVAIEAIAKTRNSNIHYLICGTGPEKIKLEQLARDRGIESQIHFLGFRTDVNELLYISDIFLIPSLREGLPRSLMEAMASGLPCIASRIRGNVDLLEGTGGGFLCEATDAVSFADKLNMLVNDTEMQNRMGKCNLRTVRNFSVEIVAENIRKIYEAEFSLPV